MQCAGASELRALELVPWRSVEAQHQVATRKLVDSDAEQQLLEQLIESAKPPERTRSHLHYLLFTPFRYPPLRHGSRFGTRNERGIWYGALTQRTLFAEVAYYRLVFLAGTTALLTPLQVQLTAFQARVRTTRGIDLTAPPFRAHEQVLANAASYLETQRLGSEMRAVGVEACRFLSARDRERGANVAVFSPAAFGRRVPRSLETWHCVATHEIVEFTRRDYFARAVHRFERAEFLVDGALPAPAL